MIKVEKEYLERANNAIQSVISDLEKARDLDSDSIVEWLNEYTLDVRYMLDSNLELLEVGLLVSYGGPTIWVWLDGVNVRVEYYEAFYAPVIRTFRIDLDNVFDYFNDLISGMVVK